VPQLYRKCAWVTIATGNRPGGGDGRGWDRGVCQPAAGPEFFADVSVTVTGETAFELAHDIAAQAEEAVHSMLQGAQDVVVNVIPSASNDEGIITQVRLLAARYGLGAHGLRLYDVLGSQTLELHVEVKDMLSLEEPKPLIGQENSSSILA